MRKFIALALVSLVVFLSSCGSQAGSPKGVVGNFLNAMKAGDLKEIKKYITKSDVSMLETAVNGANILGLGDKITEKIQNEFKRKSKDVTFDVKDEKVEGDKATVNVAVTDNGKTENQAFELIKEAGTWKVSLMSTGLNKAGISNEEMQKGMGEIEKGMEELKNVNGDSLNKVIQKGADELKKLNIDSLAEKVKSGGKDIEKALEELKKLKTN